MSLIKEVNVRGFSIPMSQSVETNWSKRSGTTSFLIEIKTEKGVTGFGEMIAFFPVELCESALLRMAQDLTGKPVSNTSTLSRRALYGNGWMRTGHMNDLGSACWAGFEMAMLDAQAKEMGVNVTELFGGRLSERLSVVANLSVGDIGQMKEEAVSLIEKGHRAIFTKVAKHNTSLEGDLSMVRELASKLGPHIPIHLDANGAWTLSTALRALEALSEDKINILCLEQPVMEFEALKSVRSRSSIPIGVNELLDSPQSVVHCASAGVADVFVLDMYEVGGLRRLSYLSQFLMDANLSVCCRAHGGSSLSYLASLQILSTSIGNLGSHQYYDNSGEQDLVAWNPVLQNGTVQLPNGPGIGLDPNPDAVQDFASRYKAGEVFSIYANKPGTNVPNFPKY